jgi:DNA-directed RNA polymerase specialized sigma24 family protein
MRGHSEEEVFRKLYERCGRRLYERACSLLRDSDEAQDALQDTFLDCMRGKVYMRGEAAPFTVLYQIVTFKAVDRLRRRSRWSGVLGSLVVDEEEGAAGSSQWVPSTDGGLIRVEALQDLAILTEGEDPQILTAAVLHFVEGHSFDEVCHKLGLKDRKVASKMLSDFAERARERSASLGQGGRA